ncbi:MAG: methyl-accepting chemotaxis protein [Xenococcaceae cyanobacterium]
MTQIVLKKESHQDENDRNSVDRQVETKENFAVSAIDSEEIRKKDVLFEFEKKSLRFKNFRIKTRIASLPKQLASWWETVSLRNKATIVAIAIGAIPVAGVGIIAHNLASHSLEKQIITEQENRAIGIKQSFKDAIDRIVDDAKIISHSPLLARCNRRSFTSLHQATTLLNSFINARHGQYQNVAFFNLQGKLLCQSQSKHPFDSKHNYNKQEYFQRAIATKATAIADPKVTLGSKNGLEVAAPVKDKTGKLVGVVVMRSSLNHFENMFQYLQTQGVEYRLISSNGIAFAADKTETIGQQAQVDYDRFTQLHDRVLNDVAQNKKEQNPITKHSLREIATAHMWDRDDSKKVLLSFTPFHDLKGTRGNGWSLAISRPLDLALAPLTELRWTFGLGTLAATVLVAAIAAILADRGTRPILRAAKAIEQIGQGKMDTRLKVKGKDELAVLEANVNNMAAKLGNYVEESALESQRSQFLKNITLRLIETFDRGAILNIAVSELHQVLKADRVIIYRFERGDRGRVIAESVLGNFPRALGKEISDGCFSQNFINQYKRGEFKTVPDLAFADLSEFQIQELEAINVKAYLAAPILIGGELMGLTIAHQCSKSRYWQQAEIDLLTQTSSRLGMALERANLLEEQKIAKERLQNRALELLMEVEPISQGDLTVRAKVTSDEIGTLADSYNSIVENLSKIVIQVQTAAQQVTTTTDTNQAIAQVLSKDASRQSGAISTVLQRIQDMTDSITNVATNAQQAEVAVGKANQIVEASDTAMNRTVDGMIAIKETVTETANKVEHLSESSQEISKVVTLIGNFAAQTKMLALNASIEAARAGQEGKGFGVVADEVRMLAQQSAEAVGDIEKIVAVIQREIREVVNTMAIGTEQVVAGTEFVGETRLSLNEIKAVSAEINALIVAIAQATVLQSRDSEVVTNNMLEVAMIADNTSIKTTQVSKSFQDLLKVARELQTEIDRFKVN